MDRNIYEQFLIDVKSESNEDSFFIKGIFKVDDTSIPVSIESKKKEQAESIKLKAEKEYEYEILPANCELFNRDARTEYDGYYIYAQCNTLIISKKTLIDLEADSDAVNEIYEEFFYILSDAVKLFEKQCVNFLEKYSGKKEEHSLTPTLTTSDRESDAVVTDSQNKLLASYTESQRLAAESTFKCLAKKFGCYICDSVDNKSFKIGTQYGKISIVLKEGATDLEVDLSAEMAAIRGYAFVANAKATYPEYFSTYDDEGQFHLITCITPNEYLPDEADEEIQKLVAAYDACSKLTLEESSIKPGDISMDVHKIMETQIEDLKKRENWFIAWEKELSSKEEELKKKVITFENEKDKQVSVINEKLQELKNREAAIKEQEEKQKRQKEDTELNQIKYSQQISNMVTELKQMRARVDSTCETELSMEVTKLQRKNISLTKAMAAMEKQLKCKVTDGQAKIDQLIRDLHEKECEISDMQHDLKKQANQIFQEERDSYEKRIRVLEERSNIAEQEINIESFRQHLDKTEFTGSVIQHAKDKEIVSITADHYDVKVVFGKLLFVDVIRTFRKAVDAKAVMEMNNIYKDIKFFKSTKNIVTARKYFERQIFNGDLVQIIRDLMSMFD